MSKILKYALEKVHRQTVRIPASSRLLYVAGRGDEIYLYALVSPAEPPVERTVWVYGTGQPASMSDGALPLGAVALGPLLYHVFIEPVGYRPGPSEVWL